MNFFENVYDMLEKNGELSSAYKPHSLTGNWIEYIDAHIQPDWIVIYKVDKSAMTVDFVRMGTYADLF